MITSVRQARGVALLVALAAIGPVARSASGPAGAAPGSPVRVSDYAALRWRLLGPLRAGWSTCAAGVPGQPGIFYFGAADGGVWTSTDAGRTWVPISDGAGIASVGALAVAPSNPERIYIGSGQVEPRYDVMAGTGLYRSDDAGRTWSDTGLKDSGHIGRILVDPRNPDIVLVAALGHLFGPNAERGVFRSRSGGRSWEKVLFKDADTGAVDLAADPASPDVVFAALWQARLGPWQAYYKPIAGPGSGIYRSADGGQTWTRLAGPGLPAGPLGRIGLAVAPGSGGSRVYATIDAGHGRPVEGGRETGSASGLYRSDDSGRSWKRVNDDASLADSYFSRLAVVPGSPDTLYVMGRSVRRSTDGGATFTITRGAPGGDDYHFIWIDPQEPQRMIIASDQGTIVTLNGGATWSSWYNQPTGQFYHLAADDRFPYWVYSSQQDSGTVGIASRSDYGQLTFRDWHPVGGDERDFSLPDPDDPETVFVSGLGGTLTRFDARTGRVENVSPWPVNTYARRPTTVRYRYGWITPIAISPVTPHALYQGAQVLFRSTDKGRHWETISPDLTGAVPGTRDCDGDVPVTRARACGYGVIQAIAPSPRERDQVWVGTNDGLVQLTRDGGRTWKDVTPAGLPDWSKISIIDASPIEPATAYAAIDRHRLDDDAPHLYRTHDYGHSWTTIDPGLPAGAYTITVRQDPVEPRLLFAGTRNGVFVSFDDGDHWQPLQQNLPATGINDLLVHGNDLIAATEGRGLWVIDDMSPLRQMARGVLAAGGPYLFPPATAYRVRPNMNRDTPLPPDEPTTRNPPAGVAIDYAFVPPAELDNVVLLAPGVIDPVSLEIVDAGGVTVRRFAASEPPARPQAERYFAETWLQPPAALSDKQWAVHRFYWDLRGPRPRTIEYDYSIAAAPGVDTPVVPEGMLVAPGRYEVRLKTRDRTLTQPLVVAADPRAHLDLGELEVRLRMYEVVAGHLERAAAAHDEIEALAGHLHELAGRTSTTRAERAAVEAAHQMETDLAPFRSGRSDDNIAAISRVLTAIATDLEGADGAPTQPQQEVVAEYGRRLETALQHLQAIRAGRMPKLDALLVKAGLPSIQTKP
jgi:photosystem II stability/assembly factor-like uncharacterized protein